MINDEDKNIIHNRMINNSDIINPINKNKTIANIYGKSDVYSMKIKINGNLNNLDFIRVEHYEYGDVLCQVVNIINNKNNLIGECKIIGYKENTLLKTIRKPFSNNSSIFKANNHFIKKVIGLNSEGAFIGTLENNNKVNVNLKLNKILTKHLSVLAQTGAGKSYTVGVLLEEMIKKNIPILIIDPHNEYSSLKMPNSKQEDINILKNMKIKPFGFGDKIKLYSPDIEVNPNCEKITLDISKLCSKTLIDSLPRKITPVQESLIYNVLSSVNNNVNFDELIFNISNEESMSKWSLINIIEDLKKQKIYSNTPTDLNDIIKKNQTTIISLKGVNENTQDILITGLLNQLFTARKNNEISQFFLVIDEAHNFCGEKGTKKTKCSNIIRTIAKEGRKFGLGLCVISQRPANIDKNVLSQCSTQIILKMTNPNDLKAVISSSEGVDNNSINEIQRLNIGTCLITGMIDIPIKVKIRPRFTLHGGECQSNN